MKIKIAARWHLRSVEQMSKNKHAVALGKRGGKARADQMTKDERIESARRAANHRWSMRNDKQQESCQLGETIENKVN